MELCYNRGCGQQFDLNSNFDDSCRHHPGVPYFHDAYKCWTCCKKKSVDFTEFLNIKGCQLSKHSNVKPTEPIKPAVKENTLDEIPINKMQIQPQLNDPVKTSVPLQRPKFESTLKSITPIIANALKESIDQIKIKSSNQASKENICEIPINTTCKNNTCFCSYNETSNTDCIYHPGSPIFHEGYKFWSCCQKRSSDFNDFLNQKGCTQGKHKWLKDEKENTNRINVRYDWHQTGTNVVITIYAKMYHYEKSYVKLNPTRLVVHLCFPEINDSVYDLDLELFGIIDVDKSSVRMNTTKVEIILPKASPTYWNKLDIPREMNTQICDKIDGKENLSDDDNDSDFNLDDVEPSLWTKLPDNYGENSKHWRGPGGL